MALCRGPVRAVLDTGRIVKRASPFYPCRGRDGRPRPPARSDLTAPPRPASRTLLGHPIDAVGFGPVRHFPAIQQTLQARLGNRGGSLAVLAQAAVDRGLDVPGV